MDSNSRKKARTSSETPEAKSFFRPWKSSDLVLKVADREFHVHRAVLILSSPVFEAMLSSNFNEKTAKKIPLPGKDASELEQMLQGIYPDRDLRMSKENCLALLKLSTEYQIDRLKTRCEEYLRCWCQEDMTVDEALEVIIVSQEYFLHEWIVKKCVDKFVSQLGQTWEKIQKHERYCELEKETVKRLTEERVNHLEKMLKIGGKAYQSYRFLLLNPKELKPRTTLLRVLKRHPLYLFKLYCVQFPSVGVRRNSEMKKKGIAGSLPRKQSRWIFLHKSTFQIPNKLS